MQVLFNVLFPDWLQTALLTILLLFVINKTVRKGIRQWQQESKAIKQRHQDAEQASTASFPTIPLCPGWVRCFCRGQVSLLRGDRHLTGLVLGYLARCHEAGYRCDSIPCTVMHGQSLVCRCTKALLQKLLTHVTLALQTISRQPSQQAAIDALRTITRSQPMSCRACLLMVSSGARAGSMSWAAGGGWGRGGEGGRAA